jgi:hypothetical protein
MAIKMRGENEIINLVEWRHTTIKFEKDSVDYHQGQRCRVEIWRRDG